MSWKIGMMTSMTTETFDMPDRIVEGKKVEGGTMTVAYNPATLTDGVEQDPKIIVASKTTADGAHIYLRWEKESKRRR